MPPKTDKTDILEQDTTNISTMAETMYVVKRTGEREEVSFDKCLKRIQKLSKDLKINPMEVSQLIITQIVCKSKIILENIFQNYALNILILLKLIVLEEITEK